MAISREERNRRARLRYRLKHGWAEQDVPPSRPALYNRLLPFENHPSAPCVDTEMIPPDRKPREPRTKKVAEEDRQMTIADAVLKQIIEDWLESEPS